MIMRRRRIEGEGGEGVWGVGDNLLSEDLDKLPVVSADAVVLVEELELRPLAHAQEVELVHLRAHS